MDNVIKTMIGRIDKFKNNKFDLEVAKRTKGINIHVTDTNQLLRLISHLMAYSQQTKSARVLDVINSGKLDNALCNFDVSKVARLNPCEVLDEHWVDIKGIRQKTKIFQIVMLARLLDSNDAIPDLLLNSKIPKKLHSIEDLDTFWSEFNALKKTLKDAETPFIRETTTLLHFLLSLGYDCVKPDSAVMKAARNIGLVDAVSTDANLRKVVKAIQKFSIENNRLLPPAVLDLYFLVCGGQTDAQKYVSSDYYNNA